MSVPTIKLRDKRKPGHCWQDNELYDCFQPVIGPLAVGVYVRITRECYDATVKMSLRELAELTGISKSAAQRAMAVLERVGMVTAKRGAARRSAEYDLADLKELAVSYDAVFDPKRCSYILPAAKREQLRADVLALEKRMQGSRVPVRDTDGIEEENSGVPQESVGVPPEGQWCPSNAEKMSGLLNSKKARSRNKYKSTTPPLQAAVENVKVEPSDEDAAWRAGWNGILEDLHRALVVNQPQAVRDRLQGDEEWRQYFSGMACAGVDRRGGCAGRLVLRVPNAKTAQQGLVKYHKRIHAGMKKYFGREVQVVLVDSS